MASRTRITGGNTPTYVDYTNYHIGSSPPPPTNYHTEVGVSGTVRSTTDVVTKDFHRRVAMGEVINNPLSIHHYYMSAFYKSFDTQNVTASGGLKAAYRGNGDVYSWIFGKPAAQNVATAESLHVPPFSLQGLRNQAIMQAWNRVEPAKSQSIVTGLELHKTLNMIGDRARKLADVIQAVKGRKAERLEFMFPGKRTKRYPKRLAVWDSHSESLTLVQGNRSRYAHLPTQRTPSKMDDSLKLWLEFRYGWTPLVHDIVDSMKAIYAADLRGELITRDRMRAYGKAAGTGKVVGSSTTKNFFVNGIVSQETVLHEVEMRSFVLYRWANLGDRVLRRLNDFGAFDVPKAIWEIVPWSFVVDWFIPIGDYLGALTPKVGVEVLASGLTSRRTTTVTQKITSSPTNSNNWTNGCLVVGDERTQVFTSLTREVPLPALTFPPIEVSLNTKRLLDSVALMKGLGSSANQPFLRK